MTFTQLEIFTLVAELRGFSAAAMQLGISQSAVSHALKALEKEMGVDLIVRHQASAELTDVGRQLLLRAREILGLSEAMRQEAADVLGQRQGSLRIGSFGATSSLNLLPAITARFKERYPGIELRIDEGADHEVVQWIRERRVDVGFLVLPDERFDTVPLVQDQMMALLPRSHALAGETAVTLAQLCADPFIMSEAGCAALIEPLFANAQLKPDVPYRISQMITIFDMVSRGTGVSIVAEMALPRHLASQFPELIALPLDPPVIRKVGLAVRDRRQNTPATNAFLELARQMAPALAPARRD
ncbi:LysR substrate-binding domain-containing protein [Janthinobacterium sp.]|uniref:LysR family transcriptional regulator n=1 Tax=Janthinobacterium sp. TaxID=1871054 RepID=UPI0028A23A61|nr:LysR substrate-binding domain-containing protein [Janthinobacterium sp.]